MEPERVMDFITFLGLYLMVMGTIMVVVVMPLLLWMGIIPKPKWWKKNNE